jgi:hypothetical protein
MNKFICALFLILLTRPIVPIEYTQISRTKRVCCDPRMYLNRIRIPESYKNALICGAGGGVFFFLTAVAASHLSAAETGSNVAERQAQYAFLMSTMVPRATIFGTAVSTLFGYCAT